MLENNASEELKEAPLDPAFMTVNSLGQIGHVPK